VNEALHEASGALVGTLCALELELPFDCIMDGFARYNRNMAIVIGCANDATTVNAYADAVQMKG
jgi:hypothetical protein